MAGERLQIIYHMDSRAYTPTTIANSAHYLLCIFSEIITIRGRNESPFFVR